MIGGCQPLRDPLLAPMSTSWPWRAPICSSRASGNSSPSSLLAFLLSSGAAAAPLLSRAVRHLREQGVGTVLLACTELPIALAAAPAEPACLDATEALARACIDWHRDHR